MVGSHKEMLLAVILSVLLSHPSFAATDDDDLVKIWVGVLGPTSLDIRWSSSGTIALKSRIIEVKQWVVAVSLLPRRRSFVSYSRVPGNRNSLQLQGLSPNTTYYIFLFCIENDDSFNEQIAEPVRAITPVEVKLTTTTPRSRSLHSSPSVTTARNGSDTIPPGRDHVRDKSGHDQTSSPYTLATARHDTTGSRHRQRALLTPGPHHARESISRPQEGSRAVRTESTETLRPTHLPGDTSPDLEPGKKTREYILPRDDSSSFAPPGVPDSSGEISTVKMVETNSSDTVSNVVATQRKRMLWWIFVVGGAGLVLIVLMSALTVLFYRPWRKSRTATLRKKRPSAVESLENSSKPGVPDLTVTDTTGRESYALESYGPRYLSIRDLPDVTRVVPSVISWGSEFDVLEGPAENIYSNTDGIASGSSPTGGVGTSSTGHRLQPLAVTMTTGRSTARCGQSGVKPKPRQDEHDVYVNWN